MKSILFFLFLLTKFGTVHGFTYYKVNGVLSNCPSGFTTYHIKGLTSSTFHPNLPSGPAITFCNNKNMYHFSHYVLSVFVDVFAGTTTWSTYYCCKAYSISPSDCGSGTIFTKPSALNTDATCRACNTNQHVDGSTCVADTITSCPAGEGFSDGGPTADGSCTKCDTNQYTHNIMDGLELVTTSGCLADTVTSCSVGEGFSDGGAVQNGICTPCGVNQYSPGGTSSCRDKTILSCSVAWGLLDNGPSAENSCTPCTNNQHSDGTTACVADTITSCAPGYAFSDGGPTADGSCTLTLICAPGQYISGSTCVDCPAGSFCDENTKTDCPAGTYQDLTKQSSCKDCEDGTYSTTVGASSESTCIGCAAGKYQQREYYYPTQDFASTSSDPGWLTREECEEYARMASRGFRRTWYTNVVTGCMDRGSRGIYFNHYGSGNKCTASSSLLKCIRLNRTSTVKTSIDACTDCLVGMYQDLTGQFTCKDCVAGTYQDLTGQSSCKDCEAGKYQSATRQTSCTYCPSGTYSTTIGASSESTCTDCPAGTYENLKIYSPVQDFVSTSSDPGWMTAEECEAYAIWRGLNYYATYYDDIALGCTRHWSGIYYNSYNPGLKCGLGGGYTECYRMNRTARSSIGNCISCPVGKYQGETGIFSHESPCIDCAVGKYQDLTGQSSCKDCEANTYQSAIGQTSCTPCTGSQQSPGGASKCYGPIEYTEFMWTANTAYECVTNGENQWFQDMKFPFGSNYVIANILSDAEMVEAGTSYKYRCYTFDNRFSYYQLTSYNNDLSVSYEECHQYASLNGFIWDGKLQVGTDIGCIKNGNHIGFNRDYSAKQCSSSYPCIVKGAPKDNIIIPSTLQTFSRDYTLKDCYDKYKEYTGSKTFNIFDSFGRTHGCISINNGGVLEFSYNLSFGKACGTEETCYTHELKPEYKIFKIY